MKKFIYDEYTDKLPFGAVKTNQKIQLKVYVINSEMPLNCEINIRNSHTNENTRLHMTKIQSDKNEYQCFSVNFLLNNSGVYYYYFLYETHENTIYTGKINYSSEIGNYLPEWQITVYEDTFSTPDWIKGGIMYQIFPDRFNKSDDYHLEFQIKNRTIVNNWYKVPEDKFENPNYSAKDFYMGNLKGIEEKLDYFKSLNIDLIYLNPVFESSENHRYSTADYKKIDPYLGTNQDFIYLTKKFKEHNIKIILDGVFSHTGDDSIYFNKYGNYDSLGAYQSKDSIYYSWYNFIEFPDKYDCWWNFPNLPNVNETNSSYMNFITDYKDGVLPFWLNNGASGYRLDVIDELPNEFLENLRKSIKAHNQNNLIIGEVWEDATTKEAYGQKRTYLLGNQIDSTMNYPWRKAIINLIKTKNTSDFYHEIMTIMNNYPTPAIDCMMNMLSTHDTERIITVLGEENIIPDREKQNHSLSENQKNKAYEALQFAVFLQFTLPGIPSIYYGDEAGLEGFSDPYCRKTYPWGNENLDILKFYKNITDIRNKYRENFKTGFKFIYHEDQLLIYQRNNLLCIINLSDENKYYKEVLNGTPIFQKGKIIQAELGTIIEKNSFHILKQ